MKNEGTPCWQAALLRSWQTRSCLSAALLPLSLMFGLAARLRRRLYRLGLLASWPAPVPVVVVGNVTVGGGGKTPTVMAVVDHIKGRGLHPGVISRGYGRATGDCREVHFDSDPREVGDEPLLIRRRTGVPVVVARRRVQAAQQLLALHPQINVIVCDDGLQHLALQRDIEVCVFDDRGLGNARVLPAGPLREPWPRPVDLILHTGLHPAFAGFRGQRQLGKAAVSAQGQHMDLERIADLGRPVLAVAGTAHPPAFFDMLTARGLRPAVAVARPDHDDFSSWNRPADHDYFLLCTEKDAAKLWRLHPDAWAVPLLFAPDAGFFEAFDQALDDTLARRDRARLSSGHGHTSA